MAPTKIKPIRMSEKILAVADRRVVDENITNISELIRKLLQDGLILEDRDREILGLSLNYFLEYTANAIEIAKMNENATEERLYDKLKFDSEQLLRKLDKMPY